MFLLNKGKYTGKITNSLNVSDNIISNTHNLKTESNSDWHYHENPHISFVIQGKDLESRKNSFYKREGGSVFFYHAGEAHRTISGQNISTNFNIEFGKSFVEKFEFSESLINKAVNKNLDVKFLLLKMQQELLINDGDSTTTIQTLLLELVHHSKSIFDGTAPKWVLVLNDLLNERWSENLTLKELSSLTDVHPTTISKHFRRYFSCTYGEYSRKLKISNSISLIKNSNLSLTDIAFQCGFADQSHFTRTFKQIAGFLPRDFRNI